MPWRESCAMDERTGFIGDHLSGDWSMTELCEISRKTDYKWLARYQTEGAGGLMKRSSAPLTHGGTTPRHLVEAIIGLRRERPTWGARKISGRLVVRHPDEAWPAISTAGEILKRAGLATRRRVHRRGPPRLGELTVPLHANHVWGVDHKGWVRLGDGWGHSRGGWPAVRASFLRAWLAGGDVGGDVDRLDGRPSPNRASGGGLRPTN